MVQAHSEAGAKRQTGRGGGAREWGVEGDWEVQGSSPRVGVEKGYRRVTMSAGGKGVVSDVMEVQESVRAGGWGVGARPTACFLVQTSSNCPKQHKCPAKHQLPSTPHNPLDMLDNASMHSLARMISSCQGCWTEQPCPPPDPVMQPLLLPIGGALAPPWACIMHV